MAHDRAQAPERYDGAAGLARGRLPIAAGPPRRQWQEFGHRPGLQAGAGTAGLVPAVCAAAGRAWSGYTDHLVPGGHAADDHCRDPGDRA